MEEVALKQKLALVTAYKKVFNDSPEGKLVREDLITKGFLLRPTFDPASPTGTHLNEGKRELLLYILANIDYDSNNIIERLNNRRKEDEDVNTIA